MIALEYLIPAVLILVLAFAAVMSALEPTMKFYYKPDNHDTQAKKIRFKKL